MWLQAFTPAKLELHSRADRGSDELINQVQTAVTPAWLE